LGRALFWDGRASANGKVACASCHAAADWSSDRRRFSVDARDKRTARHSQPVFNSMSQAGLRWTADRPSGAAQAEGSLTGSLGFADKGAAVAKLKSLGYESAFKAAFPGDADPVSTANYGKALQAYQSTLITPAPFDRYLAGEDSALTPLQKAGMRAFVTNGCAGCHNGALLGGQQLRKFGQVKDYWLETRSDPIDEGRFQASKNEAEKFFFRVPMLRNVAKTAPYFHDGSVEGLEEAIRIMASVQLGRTLPKTEIRAIAAFLDSLTGSVPEHYSAPSNRSALLQQATQTGESSGERVNPSGLGWTPEPAGKVPPQPALVPAAGQ
jgi:cytochrome c peroxidase